MTDLTAFVPGTLERTPILYLLVSLLERQSTGTLVLETPEGAKSALGVTRGVPTKMKLAQPVERLGTLLVDVGLLDESTQEITYQAAAQAKQLHGAYLVQSGALDAKVLARALRSQMLRKLRWANDLPIATAFGFYEMQDFLARWGGDGIRVSPLLAVWHLVRTTPELPSLTELITRIESQVLTIHPRAVVDSFGFDADELSVVNALKERPRTLQDLKLLNVVSDAVLHRIVYALKLTKQLDLPSGAAPFGVGMGLDDCVEVLAPQRTAISKPDVTQEKHVSPTPHSPSPESLGKQSDVAKEASYTQEVLERRSSICSLANECDKLDHYELLGVPRDAPTTLVQSAFFDLAKRYHPDRLGHEFADLRAISAKLFARIVEAHQTLADPKLRLAYDEKFGRGTEAADDEERRIHEIVNAATSFQKAEVLFKKKMLAAAEIEARRAYENDPEQADYLALLAWINANKPDSAEHLVEILIQLNTALRMSPENEKARFYRGQVLARLGRNLEAVNDYRFVVSKNPHNIDALREIRLWEMRQKAQPARQPSKEGGDHLSPSSPDATMRQSRPMQSAHPRPTPAHGQQRQEGPVRKSSMLSKLFKR